MCQYNVISLFNNNKKIKNATFTTEKYPFRNVIPLFNTRFVGGGMFYVYQKTNYPVKWGIPVSMLVC